MKYTDKKFQLSTLNKAILSTVLASTMAISSGSVFAETDFSGRITDAKNSVYFEGASIKIEELNLSTVSKRDGSFKFSNLPEGQYTLVINYLGTAEIRKTLTITAEQAASQNYIIGATDSNIDNMIVYGQRAGQAGALNRKKNANRQLSVVSSDGIGQLPDQNAAEALQRLPGLSIQRDQGEGRFVAIRGIDPNLNNVTINGLNVPSPEAGVRSVAMDVIPSELIASLEVSKTVTPDMDANAVGGSIEVKSLSAFDREGQYYSLTAQGSYNEQVSEASPKLSGSYSDVYQLNDGMQLGVAGALSWFKRSFGSENSETDGGWNIIEVEDINGDDIEISDNEYRLRKEFKLDKGVLNSYTSNSAQYSNAELERDTKDRYETQEILSMVAGGENQLNDWLVEYQLGYSKSSENEPDRMDVTFVGEDIDLGYTTSNDSPVLTQSANAHDLNIFEMDEVVYENNNSEDEEVSIGLDLTKDFVWQNNNGAFKLGGKYRSREKEKSANSILYDGDFGDITAENFNSGTVDYSLGDFGPGLSQQSIQDYVKANRSSFALNQTESDIETRANSYTSSEDVFALYAMMTLDIEKWQIVTGLRYESTDFETTGNRVELVVDDVNDTEIPNIETWNVSKDYDYLLPSLNVKYSIRDNLIARFAYTQTIARPTFGDSAAYQLIETEITEEDGVTEIERKAEVGNPDLAPYESQNIDASIEYYPENIGVISAGVFYKDIGNFIVLSEVEDNGSWDGFEEVIQPINGGEASLIGLELAWNKSFDSGLLLGANGTLVDADDALPNQSDVIGNITLGYENNKISTRLSTSYKSKTFQFNENDVAVYEAAHTQVDFSSKYYFSDTVQFYFNASNLTDEPMYIYHGAKQYNYQYEQYGRTFELGITISSL